MADTAIEWTDVVWNPTTGCDRVSPGCDHCYALTMAKRLKGMGSAKYQTDGDPRTSGPGFGLAMHDDALTLPLRWREPRRVFVNSMSDLFHDGVTDGFIACVWDVMAKCPQHTFQILTKRHARMRSWVSRWADTSGDDKVTGRNGLPPMPYGPEATRETYRSGRGQLFADKLDSMGTPPPGAAYPTYDWMEGQRWWPQVLPNVLLGVSVEDQQWADIRIPALLQTPATVRWVSCEPLIGTLNLQRWLERDAEREGTPCLGSDMAGVVHRLNWIVCGGESGPDARPMHPEWARSLRNQCQLAGVPFFFKQWGDWAQVLDGATHRVTYGGEHYPNTPTCLMSNEELIRRVGKHVAGRVLDGRTWSEYPEVAHA